MPRFTHFTGLDLGLTPDEVRAFCDERFGPGQWAVSDAGGWPMLSLTSLEACAVAKAELGPPAPFHAGRLPGAEEALGETADEA